MVDHEISFDVQIGMTDSDVASMLRAMSHLVDGEKKASKLRLLADQFDGNTFDEEDTASLEAVIEWANSVTDGESACKTALIPANVDRDEAVYVPDPYAAEINDRDPPDGWGWADGFPDTPDDVCNYIRPIEEGKDPLTAEEALEYIEEQVGGGYAHTDPASIPNDWIYATGPARDVDAPRGWEWEQPPEGSSDFRKHLKPIEK